MPLALKISFSSKSLWEAREQSLSTKQTYEDRVTQMLRRALYGIGDDLAILINYRQLDRIFILPIPRLELPPGVRIDF